MTEVNSIPFQDPDFDLDAGDLLATVRMQGLDVIAGVSVGHPETGGSYKAVGYPEALKSLYNVLDGAPKVWVSDVVISTIRRTSSVAA